jgi:carboxymethylenebutenolidase
LPRRLRLAPLRRSAYNAPAARTNKEKPMGEWIDIAGPDGAFRAYLARPAGAARGAVVVAQEIFGVNAVMRGKADWLAREGFLALCPDLFWRLEPGIDITDQSDAEWKRAIDLMNRFNVDAGVRDVAAALDAARGLGAARAGVMGYCLGGLLAYLAACRTNSDASIAYHGGGIHNHLDEAANLKKPLMLHNAMKDSFIPPAALEAIRAALGANPLVAIHEYAEQDHAFTREGGAHYDAAATQTANARTLAFFKANLA